MTKITAAALFNLGRMGRIVRILFSVAAITAVMVEAGDLPPNDCTSDDNCAEGQYCALSSNYCLDIGECSAVDDCNDKVSEWKEEYGWSIVECVGEMECSVGLTGIGRGTCDMRCFDDADEDIPTASSSSSPLSRYAGKWTLKETWNSTETQLPLPSGEGPFVFKFKEKSDGSLEVSVTVVNSIWTFVTLISDDDNDSDTNEINVQTPLGSGRVGPQGELGELEKYLGNNLDKMAFITVGDDGDADDNPDGSSLSLGETIDMVEGARMFFEKVEARTEEEESDEEEEKTCRDEGKVELTNGKIKKCKKIKKKGKCHKKGIDSDDNKKPLSELCPICCAAE